MNAIMVYGYAAGIAMVARALWVLFSGGMFPVVLCAVGVCLIAAATEGVIYERSGLRRHGAAAVVLAIGVLIFSGVYWQTELIGAARIGLDYARQLARNIYIALCMI